MPKSGPQLPVDEVAALQERLDLRLPTAAFESYLALKEKGS